MIIQIEREVIQWTLYENTWGNLSQLRIGDRNYRLDLGVRGKFRNKLRDRHRYKTRQDIMKVWTLLNETNFVSKHWWFERISRAVNAENWGTPTNSEAGRQHRRRAHTHGTGCDRWRTGRETTSRGEKQSEAPPEVRCIPPRRPRQTGFRPWIMAGIHTPVSFTTCFTSAGRSRSFWEFE